MGKIYFITNDLGQGREDKPTSTYCYEQGVQKQARYKGAENSTSGHLWWQYCTDPSNRDALLAAKSAGDLFSVCEGEIGGAMIKIKNESDQKEYTLVYPVNGKRTVELKPSDDKFKIAHFGHWICPDSEYRTSKTPKSFDEAKEAVSTAYDEL